MVAVAGICSCVYFPEGHHVLWDTVHQSEESGDKQTQTDESNKCLIPKIQGVIIHVPGPTKGNGSKPTQIKKIAIPKIQVVIIHVPGRTKGNAPNGQSSATGYFRCYCDANFR